ncbi:hypothetical protein ABID21_004640 [Pseudorhizobium tarimense]|uniref:KTSC domain-containing protein n=2 Tax=Pseudorhizobium tarimense TaxID=1079109 RepID=A0ABV2HDI2_9HYPH
MTWIAVRSTRIKKVRYDEQRQILNVAFRNGRQINHPNIPPHIFRGLVDPETDASFYYRYYVEPSDGQFRSGTVGPLGDIGKVALLSAILWLISGAIT